MSDESVFVCSALSNVTVELLRAAGFSEKTYKDQPEVFLTKRFPVEEFKYEFGKNNIFNEQEVKIYCIVEVIPNDGDIQLTFTDEGDYYERYNCTTDREKWINVAIAAGAKFDEKSTLQ